MKDRSHHRTRHRVLLPFVSVTACLFGAFSLAWIASAQDEKPPEAPPVPEVTNEVVPTSEEAAPAEDDDFGADPGAPANPAAEDDDFGGEPEMKEKDDDFGSAEDDDFGDSPKDKDDDFGELPDDKKEDAGPSAGLVGDGLPNRPPPTIDGGSGGKKKSGKPVFASAAEAHITFLKALETEKRYPSAVTCAECHPDHYREWSVSAHSYAQMSPVFNTMHAAITARTAGTNGDFCIRCHTQIGMQRDEPLFTSNLKRHPASIEGITCIVCHRVDENYGKVSGRTHIKQGDIFEPVFGPKGNEILKEVLGREDLKNKLNPTPAAEGEEKRVGKKDIHGDIVKFDPITTSGFCGSCHDVNLYNGFRLEEAFTQFKNSPAAAKGETCQDCHMGKIPGAVAPGIEKLADPKKFDLANYGFGPAARIGGDIWAVKGEDATGQYGVETPPRKRTNHMFAGPDYSIIHPALFPHSHELREAMWEYERQVPGSDKSERVGMSHLLEFKWEEGWGDPESTFEKRAAGNPDTTKNFPWPWDDVIARQTLREKLNSSFRLLNDIDVQRHQVLRRAIQFGEFILTKTGSEGIDFALEVKNMTDGHGVPTGFDAERLMFLQVTVKDRLGRTVYVSGDRDPNGDVRDLHSKFVHHHAKKSGPWLQDSAWKEAAGLQRTKEDLEWRLDKDLFSLQSKFITTNHRGGEREQILAVNYSVDPLPYIRPDTRPGILQARPATARKQARIIPPLGSKWAEYEIARDQLTGAGPYTVNFKFICQMVPVNLVAEIADQGFDYNLSPREVAKRVAYGHRVSSSDEDARRRGGSLVIWDKTLTLRDAPYSLDLRPTEQEIMTVTESPFPYKDPAIFGGIPGIDPVGGIEYPTGPIGPLVLPDPSDRPDVAPAPLFPEDIPPPPSEGMEDDSFE